MLRNLFWKRSDGRAGEVNPSAFPVVEGMASAQPARLSGQKGAGIIGLVITAALGAVYVNEGGYANHKADRGGETMYGVTVAVAREEGYTGPMRELPKHCDARRPVCADSIYTKRYIDRPGYRPMAAIEPAVFFEIVDSGVLHGTARSSGWFQGAINSLCGTSLKTDGKVGPQTIAAYEKCQAQQFDLCLRMLDTLDGAQRRFFDRIVARNPSQRVFYKGWVRQRVGNVKRAKCSDWRA